MVHEHSQYHLIHFHLLHMTLLADLCSMCWIPLDLEYKVRVDGIVECAALRECKWVQRSPEEMSVCVREKRKGLHGSALQLQETQWPVDTHTHIHACIQTDTHTHSRELLCHHAKQTVFNTWLQ